LPKAARRQSLLTRVLRSVQRRRRYHFPGPRPQIRPLVDPRKRYLVIWSAKSACTTTLIWFLEATGQAEAARRLDEWPHRYRSGVLYRSPVYFNMSDADVAGMRRLRVFRDPLDRAVSSYRHAVSMGYADTELAAFLKRPIDPEATFSFREFIDYLESVDITRTNPHHRQQRQPIEVAYPPTDVINITKQDLFTELNRFEASLGLPVTDFPKLAWLHGTEHKRKATIGGPEGSAYDMKPSRRAGRGEGFWPPTAALLTEEAQARLRRVYRDDLEAYAPYL